MPAFTVVVVASRPGLLSRLLESLTSAAQGRKLECLLVLNSEPAACARAAEPFPFVRLVSGAPKTLGGARNAAVARARGEWLCFLDDDAAVPPDYFSVLEAKTRLFPDASVIGGPNVTPPDSPLFERCAGLILASPLSAGPMARRCGGPKADAWSGDESFILCNLCVRRKVFDEIRFDEELARNEENLLLERIFRGGGKALHCPSLFVYHRRRGTLGGFLRQCLLSGRGRSEMTAKLPGSLKLFHLLPLLPVLGLPGLWLLPSVFRPAGLLYAAVALANALRLAENLSSAGWLLLLYPAAHVAYGAGLVAGALRALLRRISPSPALAAAPHAG